MNIRSWQFKSMAKFHLIPPQSLNSIATFSLLARHLDHLLPGPLPLLSLPANHLLIPAGWFHPHLVT